MRVKKRDILDIDAQVAIAFGISMIALFLALIVLKIFLIK